MSNEKQRQQHEEQDMNKRMAKSKDQGLHTKQEDQPDNECGGTGTVSTGGSSDGTGSV
jgi:hypothetical protein